MTYLLDTNVVSEQRRMGTRLEHPHVGAWTRSTDIEAMWISVITLRELETWVYRRERRDPAQGVALRRWFEERVLRAFRGRILDVTEAVARRCAPLHVPDPRPEADALIAATALVHGLTVVTRNTADFAPIGVKLLDPWQAR